jgi:pimeloyl-ACP methyl ester carboxylesterase
MSMGAAIAVDTALEHPGLVRALAVSGAGTSEPEYRDPWTKDFGVRRQAALEAGDIDGWIDASLSAVAGPHRELDEVDPDVVRRVRDMLRGTITKHTAGEPDWSVPVTDTWARAAGITVPVLAIHGTLDAADLIAMADRLAALVAGDSRTATIEDAAHYANMERPDTFTRILLEWLGDLPA